MKKPIGNILALLTGGLLVAGVVSVRSQTPAGETAPAVAAIVLQEVNPNSADGPMAALRALKANNELILERQAAQLLKLDELQLTADQIRIWARRG